MRLLGYLRSWATKILPSSQAENDTERLRFEIQRRPDCLDRSNLVGAKSKRPERIDFRGRGQFKGESRAALGGNLIETLLQDLRFALRVLRKSPSFTVVAVGTLALAIGANALVFAVLNALILRPLNVPHAETLYLVERGSDRSASQSYPDYLDLRDRNRSFESLAAFAFAQAGLDTGENPSQVWFYEVSGNYFDALGIRPYLGRLIHPSDEHGPASAPYIVLTYDYWQSHFHDGRGVVGRTVHLNKHPFTILGVAAPGFNGTFLPFHPAFFVPMINHEEGGAEELNARGNRWVDQTIGHLKAGVTPAQAIADLNSIGSYLEKTFPKDDSRMTFALARPSLFGDSLGTPLRAFMAGLMLLAGLILLAACANLGSLFAARAADRSREVALRLALGAGRMRILRQLFTEALLISVMGGAAGLWCTVALLRALSVWNPLPRYPVGVLVNPDAMVYAVALLLSLGSGLLFGVVPVKQVLHAKPYEVIKMGPSARVGRRLTARDLLLVVQIAICAVLVTSSLVAVRGLVRSLHNKFGFEPKNTIVAETDLYMVGYSGNQAPAMQKRMIEMVETIPGVVSVGSSDGLPLSDAAGNDSNVFTGETTDLRQANAAADAIFYHISPDYFHAAGTALLQGRDFTWRDDKNSPRVAVVNREFARRVFGASNALGRYFKLPDGTHVEVVGIVENGKYNGFTEDPRPAMFFPSLQSLSTETYLVVRTSGDPLQLAATIRSRLRDLDAGLPV